MKVFLITLLECSAAMSPICLIYIIAMPLLAKRYSANWLYYVWLIVVMGWLCPFRPHIDTHIFSYHVPNLQVMQAHDMSVSEPLKIVAVQMSGILSIFKWWMIASIWAGGAVLSISYNAWKHVRFLKMVNRWSEDIANFEIIDVLDTLKRQMKIGTHVRLRTCPIITSPMLVGFLRPVILLPSLRMDLDELTFILRHELIHLKRNDLWYKTVVLLATSVHWFNPVVYMMAKAITAQCEISCDELIVQESSFQQRKQYGKTLIGVVRDGVKFQTALATHFYREGSFIKARVFHIMDASKKKAGITVFCVILIAMMGSGVTFASNLEKSENIIVQLEEEMITPAQSKQDINVDAKNSESSNFVCPEGIYTFEECNITQ